MPGVGLLLAVVVALFAPQAAHADEIDSAHATVLAQLTLPSAAPAPAVRGLLVSGADVTAPIILDGTTLFRIVLRSIRAPHKSRSPRASPTSR